MIWLLLWVFCWWTSPVLAEFRCAGSQGTPTEEILPAGGAAKPARIAANTTGTRRALVLFARFKGEDTARPSWAGEIFNPDLPGSFSHFYDTMSFGKLQVRGEAASQVYESSQPASVYLADDQTPGDEFGRFSLEVLRQADRDLDFARFDSDGPDGIPNSGDDDGVVDAVFLVLDKIPTDFLQGEATGIKGLGFAGPLETADAGKGGRAIQVLPQRGTIQQGRSFAEAVGSMCHEYGHVLGLPDLYNTEFLAQGGGTDLDGAGVGAWCLMGWGALGWHGDDGPNSFCAWSREKLGWAAVKEVATEDQELRLEEVGESGELGRVLLTGREYFLLEYRKRTSSYYDRNIPGEGLLIWHVGTQRLPLALASQVVVDLECADGRWQDAGYPLGKNPDPQAGEDNLDFWAHDAAYTQTHGGNLGDATDPFDGVRFTSFTPQTNPASYNLAGNMSARIEGIHREGTAMVALVQTAPLVVEARNLRIMDEDGDGFALAGERLQLSFTLANTGGLAAQQVKTVLHSDDPWVEILQAESPFQDLKPGRSSFGPPVGGFPALRLRDGFVGVHQAAFTLEIYAGETLVGQADLEVDGVSPRQQVGRVTVIDSLGNGDGAVQGGEFFRLQLELEQVEVPARLSFFSFSMRALATQVRSVGSAQVSFAEEGSVRTGSSPEFLVPVGVAVGSQLQFELAVRSPFNTWKDTLAVEVAAGPDQTPPRVLGLQTRPVAGGVRLVLSANQVLEGGEVRRAEAVIYSLKDTTEVARVPLLWQGYAYEGEWMAPDESIYLAAGVVEDGAGNQGTSRLHGFVVRSGPGPQAPGLASSWEEVPLPQEGYRPTVNSLVRAPGNPEVLYATVSQGFWRSVDGGASWERLSLMQGTPLFVDAVDPFLLHTVTSEGRSLMSRDGGLSWRELAGGAYLMAADPVRSGRLYGLGTTVPGAGRLMISADGGESWRETPVDSVGFVAVNPSYPQYLYSGQLTSYDPVSYTRLPGTLWRSADGGETWEKNKLDRPFDTITVDPRTARGLYATSQNIIWHSEDGGRTWQKLQSMGTGYFYLTLIVHPTDPKLLLVIAPYASVTGGPMMWRSRDAGGTWEQVVLPNSVSSAGLNSIVLHPHDPDQYYAVPNSYNVQAPLLHSTDAGAHWEEAPMPETSPVIGTVVFDPQGKIYAGAGRIQLAKTGSSNLPGFYFSPGQGQAWVWQGDTWTQSQGGSYYSDYRPPPIEVLQIDPQQPQILLASVGGVDIVRSTDGGKNWQSIDDPYPYYGISGFAYHSLVADPQQQGVYYLGLKGVARSADFGETWEVRTAGLPTGDFGGMPFPLVSGLALDTQAGQPVLYAATYSDSIWRSSDEGLHWEYNGKVREGVIVLSLAVNPLDAGKLYALTYGGLYVSADQGQVWTWLLPPEPLGRKVRLRFDPYDPKRIFLVTGPKLLETRDGGQHWRSLGEDLASVPWFNDVGVDPLAPYLIYAATPWGLYRLDTSKGLTAVAEAGAVPQHFALHQNYPNPFNPTTTIRFSLAQPGEAELSIYNLLGQRVATLVHGMQEAGAHLLQWEGRDEVGRELASGVYLCRLQAGVQVETRKLLLLR